MPTTYSIIGFSDYIIENKIMYRKAYVAKSVSCKFQYRDKREIKGCIKDGVEGYYLKKGKTKRFYSLKSLRYRLKKVS